MASLSELLIEIQALIGKVEDIAFGDDTKSVTHNGVTRSSLKKELLDSFSQLQAMVQGRQAFATKALMDASGAPTADANGNFPLSEVWSDSTNNGLYGWNGSAWLLSDYDTISSLNEIVKTGDSSVLNTMNQRTQSSAVKRMPLTENNSKVLWAVTAGDKMLGYFDDDGAWHSDHTHPAHSHDALPINIPASELDILWGLAVGGKLLGYFDGAGVWHSDHSHAEFTTFENGLNQHASDIERIDAALTNVSGNQGGWLAREVPVAAEQHVFVHDGLQYRQLTPVGSNWHAPVVHHASVVRCLSDYTTGTLEPHTIIGTGEIVPEDSVLQQQLVTGQSLSLGSRGYVLNPDGEYEFKAPDGIGDLFTPVCPSDLVNHCLTLNKGVRKAGSTLIPTAELPDGVLGETVCSSYMIALANYVKDNAGGTLPRLVSAISGVGGVPYASLKKGTAVYSEALARTQEIANAASANGWGHVVNQIRIIHGESQGTTTELEYSGFIREWVSDYQVDLVAITGQRRNPVGIVCQVNTQNTANLEVPLGQLKAHNDHADIILIGPKYQHAYFDSAHMLAVGYVKTGELEARAMRFWQAQKKWQPLKPVAISASANQVTIDFNNTVAGTDATAGPVGDLALDTTLLTNPGNYGFVCSDAGVSITNVEVGANKTSVVITFDNSPALGSSISYALQTNLAQPDGGPRGNLRDNDNRDQSRFDATPLYNWCVAFRMIFN